MFPDDYHQLDDRCEPNQRYEWSGSPSRANGGRECLVLGLRVRLDGFNRARSFSMDASIWEGSETKRPSVPFPIVRVIFSTTCCFSLLPTKEKKLSIRFPPVQIDRTLHSYPKGPNFSLWCGWISKGDPHGWTDQQCTSCTASTRVVERFTTSTTQIQHATSGVAEAHRTRMDYV